MIVRVLLCLLLVICCFETVLSSPEFDLLEMDPGESQLLRHEDLHFVADTDETDRPQTSYSVDDFQSQSDSATPRSRRLKRGTWSLPRNTTLRLQLVNSSSAAIHNNLSNNYYWFIFYQDVATTIIPLNQTTSWLIFDLIYRFVLPTYPQLAALYSTLGKMDVNDIDFEGDRNDFDQDELLKDFDQDELLKDFDNLMDFEFFEKQRANDERRIVYSHAEQIFERFVQLWCSYWMILYLIDWLCTQEWATMVRLACWDPFANWLKLHWRITDWRANSSILSFSEF